MKLLLSLFINIFFFLGLFMVIHRVFSYCITIEYYFEAGNVRNFSIAVINKSTKKEEVIDLMKYNQNLSYYDLLKKYSIITPYNDRYYEFILRKKENTYSLTHNSDDFNIWRTYLIKNNKVTPISSHSDHAFMTIPSFFITLFVFLFVRYFKKKFNII